MRKVTKEVVAAFMQRKSSKVGNTETDGTTLWLHKNAIARWTPFNGGEWAMLEVSFAGWPSVTTRERLNGIPGVGVNQHKHEQFFNGEQVSDLRAWMDVPNWERDDWTFQQLGLKP
jgi:hypothetical protein